MLCCLKNTEFYGANNTLEICKMVVTSGKLKFSQSSYLENNVKSNVDYDPNFRNMSVIRCGLTEMSRKLKDVIDTCSFHVFTFTSY